MRLFGGNPRFAAKRSPAGGDPAPKEKSASGQMQCRTLYGALALIVLSCALFVGTTFAWFTDQSTGATARIMGGKLSVELDYVYDTEQDCDITAIPMTRRTPGDSDSPYTVWNPGDTFETPLMHVVNTGDLPIEYKLTVTPAAGLEGVIFFSIEYHDDTDGSNSDTDTIHRLAAGSSGTSFKIVGTMRSSDMAHSGTVLKRPFRLTVIARQPGAPNDEPWPSPEPPSPEPTGST